MNTVYEFAKKPRRGPKTPRTLEVGPNDLLWQVADIPDAEATRKWLDSYIEGKPYEGTILACWTHHLRLRDQVERLAMFVPPIWTRDDGTPLLAVAIDAAGTKLREVIAENTSSLPRAMGAYLWGLLTIDAEVGRRVIRGLNPDGLAYTWEPYQEPLLTWAKRHGMTEVLASVVAGDSQEVALGRRVHMQAGIAKPAEIGCMLRYAPLG